MQAQKKEHTRVVIYDAQSQYLLISIPKILIFSLDKGQCMPHLSNPNKKKVIIIFSHGNEL